jgi:hypothetical protein
MSKPFDVGDDAGCRVVQFVPGRRPTDDDRHPGLGSSDCAALVTGAVTGAGDDNQAIVLVDVTGRHADRLTLDATVHVNGDAPRPLAVHRGDNGRHRVVLHPDRDLAHVDLGFGAGFLRQAHVTVHATRDGDTLATDARFLITVTAG